MTSFKVRMSSWPSNSLQGTQDVKGLPDLEGDRTTSHGVGKTVPHGLVELEAHAGRIDLRTGQ